MMRASGSRFALDSGRGGIRMRGMKTRTATSRTGRKYTLSPEHRRQAGSASKREIRSEERRERMRWSGFCDVWSELGWRASR